MTRHDYMMRLYDFAFQVEEFFNDPADDLMKALIDKAVSFRMEIEEELDNGPDEGTEPDDGDALASAGFGTDEDYGGTDDRL
jgi:hypothetical protein